MRLARRWSKAMAVTFAVGAVTGTVLSFEFGLLWPRVHGTLRRRLRDRVRDRGALLLHRGDLPRHLHLRLEAARAAGPTSGPGCRWSSPASAAPSRVVTANAWMNQPQGFTLDAAGKVVDTDPLKVLFNPAGSYEVPHMILAAYMVVGFLVASIYAVGMLRGRRDRLHRLGLLIPLTVACIATPVQLFVGDTAARGGRRPPAGQVRRLRVHPGNRPEPDRVPRRHLHRRRGEGGDRRSPTSTPSWSASAPTPSSPASTTSRSTNGPPPTPCSTSPSTRWSGSARRCCARRSGSAWVWWRRRDIPATPVVPARGRDLRRRRGRRALGRLDRHRGRPPAVDRLGLDADLGSGDPGRGDLVRLRRRRSSSTRRSGPVAVLVLRAMSRRWREEGDADDDSESPVRPPGRSPRGGTR